MLRIVIVLALLALNFAFINDECHASAPSFDQYCINDPVTSTSCDSHCMAGSSAGMQICCTASCCSGKPGACAKEGQDCEDYPPHDLPCCAGLKCIESFGDHFCQASGPAPPPAPASCSKKGGPCGPGHDNRTCCAGLQCTGGFYGTCTETGLPATHNLLESHGGLERRNGSLSNQSQGVLPRLISTPPPEDASSRSHFRTNSSAMGHASKGVPLTMATGPRAGTQVVGCVQFCVGCCLISTTASLVQFYTGEQLTCDSLQCETAQACMNGWGPCAPPPGPGLGCVPDTYGGISYGGSIIALGVLTRLHTPTNCDAGGCCDSALSCPDQEFPDGRVDLCPDPSGVSYWSAGRSLTQVQLDKILSGGNPVIIISKFSSQGYTHSTLIAEKDGSVYKLWDPSTTFNPSSIWQELPFTAIQTYTPPNPNFGSATWEETVWGGGVQLC